MDQTAFRAFDLLPAQIVVLDRSGAIISANRSWAETAARGCLADRGGTWNYLDECRAAADRGCAEAAEIAEGIRAVLSAATPSFTANYSCAFAGRVHFFQLSVTSLAGQGAVVMHVEVTGVQRDALTGLANRVLFDAHAAYELACAADAGSSAGILLLDLNGFKPVNDELGHLAGDQVLRCLGQRLRQSMRDGDLAARFGGDEFGIVLAPGTTRPGAEAIARRLQAKIRQPIRYGGTTLTVTASVGSAVAPDDGRTLAELIAVADARMYGMKHRRLSA